jgi:DNA-binding response OmpR family regulator
MDAGTDYLLVVEDDPDILKLLEAALTFKGYRVVTAQNGREGLEAVRRERPAVVIADIMMPKLDGFGLVHRMRIDPETRDIPVVFITATYVAREDREFALNIGATHFIQKPIDLEGLMATVEELLQHGMPSVVEPFDELDFYTEYRRRLTAKLDEKLKQIARDERLLATDPDREDPSIQASLRHALQERDELRVLLDQIEAQLEKYNRPK